MRISDLSSDVCSSDLTRAAVAAWTDRRLVHPIVPDRHRVRVSGQRHRPDDPGQPSVRRHLHPARGATLTDAFFGTAMAMLAVVAGGFSVSSALAVRGEESAGRAAILAGPVSRLRWAGASVAVASARPRTTPAAEGFGVGVASAAIDRTRTG